MMKKMQRLHVVDARAFKREASSHSPQVAVMQTVCQLKRYGKQTDLPKEAPPSASYENIILHFILMFLLFFY